MIMGLFVVAITKTLSRPQLLSWLRNSFTSPDRLALLMVSLLGAKASNSSRQIMQGLLALASLKSMPILPCPPWTQVEPRSEALTKA